jgi:hypothetical protein
VRLDIPLKTLINPSEEELAKIIISSADRFPGLYRISSSFKQALEGDIFMKWIDFFQTAYLAKTQNKSWSRSEWSKAQDYIFSLAYGRGSRNEERSEQDIKKIMRDKYHEWYATPQKFRLAVIDTSTPVLDIECGKTYYLMGSLLRFEENSLEVGWDQVNKKSYQSLKVPFKVLYQCMHSIFNIEDITDLFIRAESVAHLDFTNSETGNLIFDLNHIEKVFHDFDPKSLVMGSAIYKQNVPVQFSKPMGVTNVLNKMG